MRINMRISCLVMRGAIGGSTNNLFLTELGTESTVFIEASQRLKKSGPLFEGRSTDAYPNH